MDFRRILQAALAACLLTISTAAMAEEITLGVEDDWWPYAGKPNGKPEGLAIDIVTEAFKSQGVTVKVDMQPFARCMEEVKRHRSLGCFDSAKGPEANLYLYHDAPLFEADIAIYGKGDSKESNVTVENLTNKIVGITNGYEYGAVIDSNTKIKKEVAQTDLQNVNKLSAGRIPYFIGFTRSTDHLVKANPALQGKIKQVGLVRKAPHWIAFSKEFKDSKKYVQLVEKGLAQIRKDGTYAKLEQKWK